MRSAAIASAPSTRYQNYPAATFDQPFGPYETGPMTDQERLRRMYELEMLRQIPESIVPGTRTWPFGYVQT